MLNDQYDNPISTASTAAQSYYIEAVDKILAGAPHMVEAFDAVVDADPGFALGHSGLARAKLIGGDMAGAQASMKTAASLSGGVTSRETAHINAMNLMASGDIKNAYGAIRQHVAEHPRDAMLAQTCTSVFGMIGFSGQPGREAELLAYTNFLLPHYGEDWWCLSQHAFSLCETGQIDKASAMIDHSLSLNPRSSHSAHVRSHTYYEAGETQTGISYLQDWLPDYDRSGLMHGHLSWHIALWAMETGDVEQMWRLVDADVAPGIAEGRPINVLTDTASILYRAELAGLPVSKERWQQVSDYALKFFPKPGLDFADFHAALAHAMAGNSAALETIIANPAGPAADMVRDCAEAYRAIARQDWDEAVKHLTPLMADHARLGGSRAQRDLLDFTLLGALLKQGQAEEARRLLAMRRPVLAETKPVSGL